MNVWTEVLASHGDVFVPVLVDLDDFERLGGRSLSIGSHGYAQMFDGTVQLLHRWIFGISGRGYSQIVDHVNRDRLDNRRTNLRVIDGSLSNANRPQAETAKNVYRTRYGRWETKVKWRGQRISLGTYATYDEGRAAVAAFRVEHPETLPPRKTERTPT